MRLNSPPIILVPRKSNSRATHYAPAQAETDPAGVLQSARWMDCDPALGGLVESRVPPSPSGMDEQVLRPPVHPQQAPPVSGPGSVEQDFPGRPLNPFYHGYGFGLSGSQTLTIEHDR